MIGFGINPQRVLKLSLAVWVMLLLAGCSTDSSTTPKDDDDPTDEPTLEETVTIGPNGGALEIEGFSLEIPAGAFEADNELSVYSVPDDGIFGDNAVSGTFRLEGVPSEFSRPLRVSIKYEGTLTDESFVAHGEAVDDGSDPPTVTYLLVSATDSSGYLVSELSPPTSDARPDARIRDRSEGTGIDPFDWLLLMGMTGYRYSTPTSHFQIHYPAYLEAHVDAVKNLMEICYDTVVADLGFSFDDKEWEWPIEVDVIGEEPNARVGGSAVSGTFVQAIKISRIQVEQSQFAEIRQAAGPLLLRFSLETYAGGWYSYYTALQRWMMVAVTDWSEERFTSSPNYQHPTSFPKHEMAPFHGMKAGAGDDGLAWNRHGHGMSAVIKYLVDDPRFGVGGLVRTYEEGIWGGAEPTAALLDNVGGLLADWWPDFFRQYVGGEIYAVGRDVFTENLSGSWTIEGGSDAQKVFAASYPDLSANLYMVNLSQTAIDETAKMELELNSLSSGTDPLTVMVFGDKDGALAYWGHSSDQGSASMEIIGLRGLIDDGWRQLLVVAVNSDWSTTFLGTTDLDLTITITEEPEGLSYPRCGIQVHTQGHYRLSHDDEIWEEDRILNLSTLGPAVGEFSGNLYTGDYSGDDNGASYTGSVNATVSEDQETLLEIRWEATTIDVWGATYRHVLKASNVPLKSDEGHLQFRISGSGTCGSITELEWNYDDGEPTGYAGELLNHTCNQYSTVYVTFFGE